MRKIMIATVMTATLALGACSDFGGDSRPGYANDRYRGRHGNGDYVLGRNDQIYRDREGRYYCKKPDGTTGTIVGGLAGGVLGNVIAPDGSKTLGTVIGAVGGAVLGRSIDRGEVKCR